MAMEAPKCEFCRRQQERNRMIILEGKFRVYFFDKLKCLRDWLENKVEI